jgi:hypothetical protein
MKGKGEPRTLDTVEAENARLRKALAVANARATGTQANDQGIAARLALARLRDDDFPELVEAVERLPSVRIRRGYLVAEAYGRDTLRSLVDAIALAAPRTPDLATSLHRVHQRLSPGSLDVLMRDDLAGARARVAFLEVVERYIYAPAIQAAFARSSESYPDPSKGGRS